MAPALVEPREQAEHIVAGEDVAASVIVGWPHQGEVLLDGQLVEDALAFGHEDQAAAGPLVRGAAVQRAAASEHLAGDRGRPRDQPASALTSVLLPAPLAPTTPTMAPPAPRASMRTRAALPP